jgi:hypothetical protein
MFYVPQDFSDTTANISYCSGATTEAVVTRFPAALDCTVPIAKD